MELSNLTQQQKKAISDFLDFANIKRLREYLTLKELQPAGHVDDEVRQDFISLYRLLEKLDSKR